MYEIGGSRDYIIADTLVQMDGIAVQLTFDRHLIEEVEK